MKKYLENFKKFQPLLLELISRDIKIKYRRSLLGVFWTLLNPLFMMIVLSVVFSSIFKFDIENFPIYILSGQVIFNFFSESTTNAMNSIISNAGLIKKVYIPKYLFTVSKVAASGINIIASYCALVIVMICMRVELHYLMILSFIPMILIVVFSMGVGLILAAMAVKFRDIIHLYGVLITAIMYLTPIIYPMNILPDRISFIVKLNPITNIVEMFRDFMLNNQMPDLSVIVGAVISTILVFFIGAYAFYKQQDSFILNV